MKFIFEHNINATNPCQGAAASDFTFLQRYSVLLHLRTVENTHCVGSLAGLNNSSKDAAIFVYPQSMLAAISTLLWHRQSKTLNLQSSGCLEQVNASVNQAGAQVNNFLFGDFFFSFFFPCFSYWFRFVPFFFLFFCCSYNL